jgi:DNA-binding helix-hairpin-helix protein with protein kinase domain
MSKPQLFCDRKPIELTKRIGRGGEGEVYLVAGAQKCAVKIYTGEDKPEREAKVRAMVRTGLAQSSSLVAFPEGIVTDRSGKFAGFSMRLVDGFKDVHFLTGPKSRKTHFPKADFRFLVRAAANTARAVAQVHGSSCIIGDLNESGILVSSGAIVALIDADSFQLEESERIYPCLVGKPEFTPPELQGKSFAGITRSKTHDQFGLAVIIFQLLFMGRHPYAGHQKGSDLSLDQMIGANLFAYSQQRQTGVSPPGILPSLGDFPRDIAEGFERAFGLDTSKRPSAADWVNSLQGLERRLSRCSTDAMHYYPSTAQACPWCRMEHATGAVLFLSPVIIKAAAVIGIANFDVEKAWNAIKNVVLPDPNIVTPKLSAFSFTPSADAKAAKRGGIAPKILGVTIAAAAVAAWVYFPNAWWLWVGALLLAWTQFTKTGFDQSGWRDRYAAIDQKCASAVSNWRAGLGIAEISKLKNDLEAAVVEYRGLPAAKTQAVTSLQSDRKTRQLNEFLDRFLIKRASISGIGQARVSTLASFGIETAADIQQHKIMSIPGFGATRAKALMAWRQQHERRFAYVPAPNQADVAAQGKVDAEFANRNTELAKKIAGGQVELTQAANTLRQRLQVEDQRVSAFAQERAQLQADLEFLGISIPASAKPVPVIAVPPRPAPRPISRPATAPRPTPAPSSPPNPLGVLCPSCGSAMIRRTAKRGYRAGNQFWGCSRYPNCRGTRP